MTTADLHTLTGAYALHALDDDERERFERHAADCADCAQEVRELTATAARLGLAVTDSPGPALKDQVMRRITTVRQEAPRTLPLSAPRAAGIRRRRRGHWALAAAQGAAGRGAPPPPRARPPPPPPPPAPSPPGQPGGPVARRPSGPASWPL
ncbi:zf-HC2 domain-containing protein, partial [Streptomyces sp. NPDC127077]|uniref:RskA family anti-sigma factor n=1 Tax=Streptomyces sp. NPDC127077 TaxID=3347131 RepID=UPI003656F0E4